MDAPHRPLSLKSNGEGKDLSPAQVESIARVSKLLLDKCGGEWKAQGCFAEMEDYCCDPDNVRRFLVARGWNETKAFNQMVNMQAFRLEHKPWTTRFCEISTCAKNPWAYSQRISGLDARSRLVSYSVFSHSNDRWNVANNMAYLRYLLFDCEKVIQNMRRSGKITDADQMQWVWVIDFHGFGIWDQNPNSAVQAGHLLNNFPEMLNLCVLIDAPRLFSATFSLVSAVLDDRVRAKIVFADLSKLKAAVTPRLGEAMADWLVAESTECRKKLDKTALRKYWQPPSDGSEHDARGLPDYVNNPDVYIKTPGDLWEEKGGKV